MALTASTLALFVFLLPGLVYRVGLYRGLLVARPLFDSGAIYTALSLIFCAVAVYGLFLAGWLLLGRLGVAEAVPLLRLVLLDVGGVPGVEMGGAQMPLLAFGHPLHAMALFAAVLAVAWLLALVVQAAAIRHRGLGGLL